MSVYSVLPGLQPSYGPLSGNASQNAKAAARAKDFPEQASVTGAPSQITGPEADGATPDSPALNGSSSSPGQFQGALELALQRGRTTAAETASAASAPLSELPLPGIAVYRRVSQYGNNETSTSALLERWNNIMQSGKGADGAAADFAKVLARHETPGLESGVIDLTA
jgi:hypothetical protein